VKSRAPIKVAFLKFRKDGGVPSVLRFDLVHQFGKGGTWLRVMNDTLPLSVTAKFRKKGWQISKQPFPFVWREQPNGSFNFFESTHTESQYIILR